MANPSVTEDLLFSVATSVNTGAAAAAAAVDITAATSGASVSASNYGLSTGANYTLSNVDVLTGTASTLINLDLYACAASPAADCPAAPASGTGGVTFSTTPGSYSVTDATNSAVTFSVGTPTFIAPGTDTVGGVLLPVTPSAAFTNNELTIVATGTNPGSVQENWFAVDMPAVNGVFQNAGGLTFGSSISSLTVTPPTPGPQRRPTTRSALRSAQLAPCLWPPPPLR